MNPHRARINTDRNAWVPLQRPDSSETLLALACVAVWVPGCATQNGNPVQARANTAYVDFYNDSVDELY